MRIGVDAMGGDLGPAEVAAGVIAACEHLDADDRIVLVGDEQVVAPLCDGCAQVEVHHATQAIDMGEPPVEALKTKSDSSIAVLTGLQKAGELDACISAGNTGACVASAQMGLRRLAGVQRPGILVVTPTAHGPVALCDVGANVDCRPQHLHQYGLMASVYMRDVVGVDTPRVGLLSVGEEEGKGNTLVKSSRELMVEDKALHFVGNVEGRDLFNGRCDVMVCEGFVGNVVLKLMEGMGEGLMKALMGAFMETIPEQMGAVQNVARMVRETYDFNEYGGAPLLGVDGIWFICHGASNRVGIKNAIRRARTFAATDVNERITELLSRNGQEG